MGSLSLVMNGFFSTCILGERYTSQDLIGTVIICGGSVLALVFEQHGNDENKTDVEWLKKLFKARTFVIYSALKGTSLGLLVLWETTNTFVLRLPPLHSTVYVVISAMMGSFSFTYSKCAGEFASFASCLSSSNSCSTMYTLDTVLLLSDSIRVS